ncbi:hypothetical protein CN918_25780 [Priestia megaterium]|nr:hypothetical protein CN918_25780 [Priestia megaterium]
MKKMLGLTVFVAIIFYVAIVIVAEYNLLNETITKYVAMIIIGLTLIRIKMPSIYKLISLVLGIVLSFILMVLTLDYLP